jgi:hypothetical protein
MSDRIFWVTWCLLMWAIAMALAVLASMVAGPIVGIALAIGFTFLLYTSKIWE